MLRQEAKNRWRHQQQRLIFGIAPPATDDPKINHFIPNNAKKRESEWCSSGRHGEDPVIEAVNFRSESWGGVLLDEK